MITTLTALLALTLPSAVPAEARDATVAPAPVSAPQIADTRVFRIRQTVTLAVPAGEHDVRLWVPVPADGAWQRVLDRRVVDAPEGFVLEKQPASGSTMIVSRTRADGPVHVTVETTVMRQSPAFDLTRPGGDLQAVLFTDELRQDDLLMNADPEIAELAREACAGETSIVAKVVKLLDAVADVADHYSKDASKPKCGRGSAQDCMVNGGGCCTDLHSLFIAAARAQQIPARIQFGYRLNPAKENVEYDPSYRCWTEFYLPGSGWVPTDLVVADGGERDARKDHYGRLDARRVWLWEGRGFDLVPKQSGAPMHTMLCGFAEIDGVGIDVLPGADGSPSALTRVIMFQDLTPTAAVAAK